MAQTNGFALDGRDEGPATLDLLVRCRNGDADAKEQLFSRLRGTLLARARRHRLMRALARDLPREDVVHEVIRRVIASELLRKFEYRGRGSLDAALAKALEHVLIDLSRERSAQKRGGGKGPVDVNDVESTEGLDRFASDATSPTVRARANELVERARALLEPLEFAVWHGVEIDGFTHVELASRLDTTPSATRGVLRRALLKLLRAPGVDAARS